MARFLHFHALSFEFHFFSTGVSLQDNMLMLNYFYYFLFRKTKRSLLYLFEIVMIQC